MKYWIISDTHFGHDKIKEYCGRPENFEQKILDNLWNTLKPEDILIHLGDFCWHNHQSWHFRFHSISLCKKWLVRGNHDKKSNSWYLSHGWDFVGDRINLTMYGKSIAFTHRPILDDGYDLDIHGHFHNVDHRSTEPELIAIRNNKQRLVMMEHAYIPINLRSIADG